MAPVQVHDPCGEAPEEGPVVGHEEEASLKAEEEVLQPLDGIQVQVVGRLVQEKYVGLGGQRPGQEGPPLQPPRRAWRSPGPDPLEERTEALYQVVLHGGPRGAGTDHGIHRAPKIGGNLLGKKSHPGSGFPNDLPPIRIPSPCDDAQEGGFLPGLVPPHQPDTLPPLDLKAHGRPRRARPANSTRRFWQLTRAIHPPFPITHAGRSRRRCRDPAPKRFAPSSWAWSPHRPCRRTPPPRPC